ncbi:Histone deacetylase 10, partial [Caligus rogercresseyi]
VMDTVLSKKTNAGISLINHTNETGMHDVGPIYGKLKHKIPRTMSIILNDGMISPKRNSFPCEDDSILRFNILHSHEEDECNPFLDASDDHANKYDVTIRLGKYTQPVDSDYLNLIYRILLPIG